MSTASKPEAEPNLAAKIALGIFLGLACYAAFLAFTGDLEATLAALKSVPLSLIATACGLSLLNYLVRFPRWERYRQLVGVEISRSSSLCVYLAGLSLTVTPGKIGEAFKSVLIRKLDGSPIHKTAPIVLAERVTDLLGFLFLIMLASLAGGLSLDWIFWTAASICLSICLALLSPTISDKLVKLSAILPGGAWLAPRLDGPVQKGDEKGLANRARRRRREGVARRGARDRASPEPEEEGELPRREAPFFPRDRDSETTRGRR